MPLLELSRTTAPHRARAFVFEDPVSRALLGRLDELAPTEATVLITGETGTGKEIVARYLHEHGPRQNRPFVAVNCGALSESLVESELFGHERGAFTGAVGARPGWFEAAHGGTLFLDELGELPAAMQVKLLRVLQEHEVVRIGARQPIAIDVRLIAATNANLEQAVAQGRFRADLYYRIHVAAIAVPPLRERPGDIVPLARYFVERLGGHAGRAVELTIEAIDRLRCYSWPGNIRELENVILRAVLASRGGPIRPEQLGLDESVGPIRTQPPLGLIPALSPSPPSAPLEALEAAFGQLFEDPPPGLYARVEAALICTAYRYCGGNQLQTARLLGISRNIVRARLIQFGELAGTLRGSPSEPPPIVARTGDSDERDG